MWLQSRCWPVFQSPKGLPGWENPSVEWFSHMVVGRRPLFLTTRISSLHRLPEHPPDMITGFLQHKLCRKSRGNHHTFCGWVLGVTYSYLGLISFVRSKILNLTQREGIRIHLCKCVLKSLCTYLKSSQYLILYIWVWNLYMYIYNVFYNYGSKLSNIK